VSEQPPKLEYRTPPPPEKHPFALEISAAIGLVVGTAFDAYFIRYRSGDPHWLWGGLIVGVLAIFVSYRVLFR
jgi:hypothetical protein